MNLNIRPEVTGVNLTRRHDWDLPLTIVAHCDVRLDGLSTTLYGAALAWKEGKWIALPPKSPGRGPAEGRPVRWEPSGPFPELICDAMVERYAAFGGPIPDGCERTVAEAIKRVEERRDARAAFLAAKAGGIEHRTFPFVLDRPSAESEICDRAGL